MYNSTIILKKKPCKSCGELRYIKSKGRCEPCATAEDFKPIAKVSAKRYAKEFQTESWTNLRDELDVLLSLYVRLKEADSNGMNHCYTCDKKMHYKQLQNGHCISRGAMGLRFALENCRPQCPNCNSLHETNPSIFRNKLELETPGILLYLDDLSRQVAKLSVSDLKEMVIDFRQKVRFVKSKVL